MVAPRSRIKSPLQAGFTLVELSIVMVIIGLIIGGVLVGRDLISAATVRAQISQIEKYQAAVNTFRGKYGYLPGDIPDPYATQYGFVARGQYAGEGDGNGLIEGVAGDAPNVNWGMGEGIGESVVFWSDLSAANLIYGNFSVASSTTAIYPGNIWTYGTPTINDVFPSAKVGSGNYVYAWSGGINAYPPALGGSVNSGPNYFAVSAVNRIAGSNINSTPAITIQQAYSIDKKIDDGFPQTGRVVSLYLTHTAGGNGWIVWAGGGVSGGSPGTIAAPTSTTCYDNSGNSSNPMQYSMGQNNGAGLNCALSFQFQ